MLDFPEGLLKSYVIASFQMSAKKAIIIPFIHVGFCFLVWMEEISEVPRMDQSQMNFLLVDSCIGGLGFFLEGK